MKINEFIDDIKKVKGKREHKIIGSYGTNDALSFYKHTSRRKYNVTSKLYRDVINKINSYLCDRICENKDIKLPCRMGILEVRKRVCRDNVGSHPIDWDRTLKLWAEDKESKDKKLLVKHISKDIYRVHYNKTNANYTNKHCIKFSANRQLKLKLKESINEGIINDAYILYE